MRTHVLSLQTPLLGNRTYGELLRAAFAASERIAFDAHWSTEAEVAYGDGRLERQLRRVFLKMIERPWIRERNLDVFPLRYELGTSYWARRTLNALLRAGRPDVLHVHTQAISFLSLDIMRRIPTVLSADGTSFQMAEQQLGPRHRWTFAVNHALERLAFRSAAAVVAFSRWAAGSIIERHGVSPERVHVIPPGIDVRRFDRIVADRERIGDDGIRRVLFVGGEFERKGGPLLTDVFRSRFGDDPAFELHLMTRSADVPEHPRIVVHRGVEPYSPQWFRLFARADVFVLPTKRDQSPIAFLEAMAAGLPVVTTAVGSAAEIVVDGETGYILSGNDGAALAARLEELLRDRQSARRLGLRGRDRARDRYESSTNAARLEAVFQSAARTNAVLQGGINCA